MSVELFDKEQNELLEVLIERYFLQRMNSLDYKDSRIELFITPECNLRCGYCYLNKHGEELYPNDIVDHEIILFNMNKFLKYVKSRNIHLYDLDLFSGEIWGEQFGWDVLQALYDFYYDYKFTEVIVIPSNMTFLFAENGKDNIQRYINMFKDIGVRLIFSASVDGAYLEDSFRAFKKYEDVVNYERNDNYFNEIFKFCAKNQYAFHPMVASKSCKYWVENFDWFMRKFDEFYNYPVNLMMLEVRDDNWTQEDIDYLKILLKHIIDYKLENWFNGDIERFSEYVARLDDKYDRPNNISVYNVGNRLSCGVQSTLCIRLGDMAIIPCHRTAYPQYIYGWMDINGEKMNIKASNPEFAVRVLSMNPNMSHPGCDSCLYKKFCMKGCLGSQFETNTDPLLPCVSVCEMMKQKIDFLIDTYEEMGVWEYLERIGKGEKCLDTIDEIRAGRCANG